MIGTKVMAVDMQDFGKNQRSKCQNDRNLSQKSELQINVNMPVNNRISLTVKITL